VSDRIVTSCRACGSSALTPIFNFGDRMALANDFVTAEMIPNYQDYHPLHFMICRECTLGQLQHVVSPYRLYSDYAYVTSTSETMNRHLDFLVQRFMQMCGGLAHPKVLEIGSNTGLFLRKFELAGCHVMGYEPATNIATIAKSQGIQTREAFFNDTSTSDIGKWDIVVGRHVLAHIDDLYSVLCALEQITHERSIIGFEVPYLVSMHDGIQFDTIYHEHLSYFTVKSVVEWLQDSAFSLDSVDRYSIHGGSIMFYLRRRPRRPVTDRATQHLLRSEEEMELGREQTWDHWCERVRDTRQELLELIRGLQNRGRTVAAFGASAKGNTLLQYCHLGPDQILYVADNTPFKQGRFTPGTWIPVVKPETIQEQHPDYLLLLAWNFAQEIVAKNRDYIAAGGKFIVPIPKVALLD